MTDQAEIFCKDLETASKAGRVSEATPITARTILEAYKKKYGWDLTDSVVQKWAEEARENLHPVLATNKGYFYALKPSDFDHPLAEIAKKRASLIEMEKQLKLMQENMVKRDEGLFNHPIVQGLIKEFDAKRVA